MSELERRHSFVFLNKMKLHSSVQAFLREYLLHPLRRSSKIVDVIQNRAINYLRATCIERESHLSTLDKVIEDDIWKESTLGLIHHSFWVNSDFGWNVFVPAFVAGLVYDRDFSRACIEIIDTVFESLRSPEKQRLEVIKKGMKDSKNQEHVYEMLNRLEKLNQIQSKSNALFARDVSSSISLLQGQSLYSKRLYSNALAKYEETEKKLGEENGKVRELLGNALFDLGATLSVSNPLLKNMWFGAQLLDILKKAIAWMSGKHRGYEILGFSLATMERYEEAIQSFKSAIELNEFCDDAYYGIALAYRNLRNIESAIENCQLSIKINPNNYLSNNGLGYLYNLSGRFELAVKHLEKAIEIAPYIPEHYLNFGITKLILGRSEEAKQLFQRTIEFSTGDSYIGTKWSSR